MSLHRYLLALAKKKKTYGYLGELSSLTSPFAAKINW